MSGLVVSGLKKSYASWREDLLVLDGVDFELAPGGSGIPRPLIEIVLAQRTGKKDARPAWLVELIPSAPEASIVTADPRTGAAIGRAPASIDLDKMGRSDVAW